MKGPVKCPAGLRRTGEDLAILLARLSTASRIAAGAEATLVGRARASGQAPGLGHARGRAGVIHDRGRLIAGRVDGAPAKASLELGHRQLGPREVAGAILRSGAPGEEDPQITGDGIETARVHDTGSRTPSGLVVLVDGVLDEEHFTGQIAVVRAGGGACGHQRLAVLLVGPHGCDNDLGSRRVIGQGSAVGGIDHEQGPLTGWSG